MQSARLALRKLLTVRKLVTGVVILAVASSAVVGLLRLRIETSVESALPSDDPVVAALEEHGSTFGGNPIVVLLESKKPRQLLLGDDEQLMKLIGLEGKLSNLPDVAAVYGPATIANQVAGAAQGMLATISGARDGLRARAEAEARGKGLSKEAVEAAGKAAVEDFDKRYANLMVHGLPGGLPTTKNLSFVKEVIFDENGKAKPRWHFVVPNENSVAVLVRPRADMDQASTRRLVESVNRTVHESALNPSKITVTGAPAITAAVGREALSELPLLGGLALLVLVLRFVIWPGGGSWWRRLWPPLAAAIGSALTLAVFGLAGIPMSIAAIVLFPLLLGIGSSFLLYLATSAGRRRVIVVCAASAIAFGSLVISPLPFVRQLGIALGLGVILTVGLTIAAERTFGLKLRLIRLEDPSPVARTTAQRQRPRSGVTRWLVLGCAIATAASGWVALSQLEVRASPQALAGGLPEMQQVRYVESVLGSSGEVSVVLRGNDVQSVEALNWMQKAEQRIVARHGDALRPVVTAPDLLGFLGDSPAPEQISAGLQLLPRYLRTAVFSPDGRRAVLTFGMKFKDLQEQSELFDAVRQALPPPPDGTRVEVVGLPVAAARAYELVSADRYVANLAGIVAAGAVLLIWLRRRRDSLLAVLAAFMATGWMLAGLWLAGVPLNPLTVALGSLATVTACEFTVLLADSRRPRSNRMIGWACATSAIGYLALVPSQIGLVREFGITLAVTVLFSYFAAIAVVRCAARPASNRTFQETQVEGKKSAEVVS